MNEKTDTTTLTPVETRDQETLPASTNNRKRDPFSMLNDIELLMDRMLNRRWPLFRNMPEMGGDWAPQVDMYEQGGDLVVKAELPGVSKDDIDVAIDHGDLVIRGERKSEHEEKGEHTYRMERSFGSFYRRLPLPEGVRDDQISATYNDGVLEIRTPKPQSDSSTSKKITIH